MTKIINCSCSHEFQDKKYGPNKRVANKTANSFRCTVCDKNITSEVVKKK